MSKQAEKDKSYLLSIDSSDSLSLMFSHIVIFWTKPEVENSEQRLIDGLNRYLPDIPGVISMHVGKCAPSDRPVVDQSYQIALNITFKNKIVQDEYQVHPQHVEFVEKVFKEVCDKVVVYDFGDLE
ncbi:MAG: Dabb family protein [Verrucomicrobiota bacterium]|mgnify:FL=1|nr:Dabb family protein [Verrucomicrobiota bacterium]MED5453700.1 Dabb family protein [Verrucomicrobiota bacterium]|tara:strand:- start:3927 stop:4304 length:378 start_codon:yes stop_codon:yes gene_type:complete